jgi:U4/U6 small nuclear ribonucleoprotein PRP31
MSVTVSFSASTGKLLTEKELKEISKISDEILDLDRSKSTMLNYLERRMSMIAPNVSAIVGARVASKLIASAGGI